MPEPVEVAIEAALLSRAQQFADVQSPPLAISMPNVAFDDQPEPVKKQGGVTVYGKWLRASFLPAPSVETGISFRAHVQHYGLFQIDAFCGAGAGELAVARLASSLIQYFPRGLQLQQDGFQICIDRTPYRGSLIIKDGWSQIPVTIPYQCFARPAS